MPKRIDSLTPEQTAMMETWKNKWIAIGLRTGAADRPTFERAVADCYRAAKLEPPKRVVWVPSPIVGALAYPIAAYLVALGERLNSGGAVRGAVRGAVGGAVGGAVDGAVGGAVGGAVRGAVRGAVDGAVRDAVRGAVDGAVDGVRKQRQKQPELEQQIRSAISAALSQAWWHYLGGQFWVGGWYCGSPAFVSFFLDVCGLELSDEMTARARAYEAVCSSACWFWPHRDFVMACERPSEINRNERGQLHSVNGAAVCWPDGWGVYAVNGVRVPADIIEDPESITVARIDGESNAEIRRVMIERFGVERYITDSGAKVLHEDTDLLGHPRRLLRKERPGDEPIVVVFVQNSTLEPDGHRKQYMLRVHPELRPLLDDGSFGAPQKMTCHNAVASTFGLRGEEYGPEVET